jgi:predicted Zn-dependent protease
MCLRIGLLLLAGWMLPAQPPSPARDPASEKEAALGAQLASDVRRETTALPNQEVVRYVEKVGDRLAAAMPPERPFTFSVIVDDRNPSTHEPLSLVGGYIFVPAALILAARGEAEFAGMLAHAMAHVVLVHDEVQTRAKSGGPLVLMGSTTSLGGDSASVPVGFTKVLRARERAADLMAVQVMARVGYDPAAPDFFRIQELVRGSLPKPARRRPPSLRRN